VYQFTFTPPPGDIKTPVLKYGISDATRWGMSRVDKQLALFRSLYGLSVQPKILTRTYDRNHAKFLEELKVSQHIEVWGYKPREQDKPNGFDWY
jgi:hypothetical protein